jgi:hypothetical protein
MPVLTHTRCGTCCGVLHAGEKNQSFKSKIMHKVTTEEETPISHTHLFILHIDISVSHVLSSNAIHLGPLFYAIAGSNSYLLQ